jgi:hypothetical protein
MGDRHYLDAFKPNRNKFGNDFLIDFFGTSVHSFIRVLVGRRLEKNSLNNLANLLTPEEETPPKEIQEPKAVKNAFFVFFLMTVLVQVEI